MVRRRGSRARRARCSLRFLPALVLLLCGRSSGGPFEFVTAVDTNTVIPGSSATFGALWIPSVDADGNMVFWGLEHWGGGGLYTRVGGTLRLVADASTPIPGQENTFAHGFRSYGAAIDG